MDKHIRDEAAFRQCGGERGRKGGVQGEGRVSQGGQREKTGTGDGKEICRYTLGTKGAEVLAEGRQNMQMCRCAAFTAKMQET